jgi:hypothetical protein
VAASARPEGDDAETAARAAIPLERVSLSVNYAPAMGKFLAVLNGAAGDADKAEFTEQQRSDFMNAWAAWAQRNEHALVDPGAPLFRKKRVTARGVEDFTDSKTGYAIVEAESHDDAARLFSDHPHIALTPENSIEVLECPPIPA